MTLTTPVKRKPKPHHKKVVGAHHKQNKTFHKTYWPYLPMFLIVMLGLAFQGMAVNANRSVLGYATDMTTARLFSETNEVRKTNNVKALTYSEALAAAAQAKADDMVARNYWSHVAPDGKQPWAFIKEAGYAYQYAGENLAYGFATSHDAINGWLNSPKHKENMLSKTYSQVGFGVAAAPNYRGNGPETVVVAMYALPVANAVHITATVPQTTANTPAPVAVSQEGTSQISRLQLVASRAPAGVMFIGATLLTLGAFMVFFKHAAAWKRKLIDGEHFILHHPLLDIAIVAGVTVLIILSQTVGFIA